MPTRPRHPCAHPGCPRLVATGARCPEHTAAQPKRPSASAQGYGAPWRKIRAAQLQAFPFCSHVEHGRRCPKMATDVHHIVRKVDGGSDSFDNLASLCHEHHSGATLADNNRRRAG